MNLTGPVLPDVNVWIAYVMSGHAHHHKVTQSWRSLENAQLGFCRVTQMAFLRLLTNSSVMGPDLLDAPSAWLLYQRLREEQAVTFLSEPAKLEETWQGMTSAAGFSAKHWTDAYLAAFARSAGGTLLTLDRGMKRFPGVRIEVW
jgi:toxin-antitoxin system PIN domain toxin